MATRLNEVLVMVVMMKKKKRGAANLTAHSAPVDKFITVNLLGTTLLTKADCAAIFSLSHSILCIC